MITLEELEKRIKNLESMLFDSSDETSNTEFKKSVKYIVLNKDEKRILSYNGFKAVNDKKDYTIKLFNSRTAAKDFLDNHRLYSKLELKIKRVRVTYELIEVLNNESINLEELKEYDNNN